MKSSLLAEFLGSMFLLVIIVGSGIMGEALAHENNAIALLANSLATGAGLFVLIQCLGPLSGAHFNPVVSLVEFLWGRLEKKRMVLYWVMQFSGAVLGVFIAHLMFQKEILQISQQERIGIHLWIAEIIATFGLIATIALAAKKDPKLAPMAIALYITSAYWFTSSTSFANPVVTFARMLTNTFCGIAPSGAIAFICAQVVGGLLAFLTLRKL